MAEGEVPKADEGQDHRHAAADGDEQWQDRWRDGDSDVGGQNDAGRIDSVVRREPDRGHAAIAEEGAQDWRARMAERDRPVEREIDDRCDDEAWRAGEFRRQAAIFGADKGDARVDDIPDDADRREGWNLFDHAPVGRGGRLDGVHRRPVRTGIRGVQALRRMDRP